MNNVYIFYHLFFFYALSTYENEEMQRVDLWDTIGYKRFNIKEKKSQTRTHTHTLTHTRMHTRTHARSLVEKSWQDTIATYI